MTELNINNLAKEYEYLIPDILSGLVIVRLNKKIMLGELNGEFGQGDIKQVIIEVTEVLPKQNIPHVERVLKNLLHYFIERPPGAPYQKFALTEYAKRFIKLIENKISNPHKDFPLKHTFEKYLLFSSNDIKDISQLVQWHVLSFNNASTETVLQHLEALQDEVDSSISSLKDILQTRNQDAVLMVKDFVDNFVILGDKASQLAEALDLKNESILEIKKCVDFFYRRLQSEPHFTNELEKENYQRIESDWKKAAQIYLDVKQFFLRIDQRIELIRSRIVFASSKLTELQENFKAQSFFKKRLKKFLSMTLDLCQYGKDEIKLNQAFPRVKYPFENFKFLSIPYYDFGHLKLQNVEDRKLDEEYHKQEISKIELELLRQEKTEKWFVHLKQELSLMGEIDLNEYFIKIRMEENDIEIPLQANFEILQYANKSPDYKIEIFKVVHNHENVIDVKTWKMKIKNLKGNTHF